MPNKKSKNKGKRGKSIVVDGKEYPSISDAAKAYNLSLVTVIKRMKRGWSIDEAFGIKPRGRKGKTVVVDGKEYPSISDVARACGLPVSAVRGRLRVGWDINRALEIEVDDRHGKEKTIVLEGKEYPSISDAARAYNLSLNTVKSRLRLGWSTEEAFGIKPRERKRKGKTVVVDGKEYPSISDAAKAYNLSLVTVIKRMKRGWSIDKAFGIKPRGRKGKTVVVDGKEYPSISDAAKAYNLSLNTVRSRLRLGWSIDEAFGVKSRKHKGKTLIVNGKEYPSISDAAKSYGLPVRTVRARLRLGWDVNKAFNTKTDIERSNNTKGKTIVLEGKKYLSISDAAKAYNLPLVTVSARMKRGWSIEEAFGIKPRKHKGKTLIVNGKEYSSISDAARSYGLPVGTVIARLRLGWDINRAFNTKIDSK